MALKVGDRVRTAYPEPNRRNLNNLTGTIDRVSDRPVFADYCYHIKIDDGIYRTGGLNARETDLVLLKPAVLTSESSWK